jgi:hypothetical protein
LAPNSAEHEFPHLDRAFEAFIKVGKKLEILGLAEKEERP